MVPRLIHRSFIAIGLPSRWVASSSGAHCLPVASVQRSCCCNCFVCIGQLSPRVCAWCCQASDHADGVRLIACGAGCSREWLAVQTYLVRAEAVTQRRRPDAGEIARKVWPRCGVAKAQGPEKSLARAAATGRDGCAGNRQKEAHWNWRAASAKSGQRGGKSPRTQTPNNSFETRPLAQSS